jgi:hypothetical protein
MDLVDGIYILVDRTYDPRRAIFRAADGCAKPARQRTGHLNFRFKISTVAASPANPIGLEPLTIAVPQN